jgi:hypothetical protein
MIIVAVQPVLAIHYCGGHLYSLNLLENKSNDACCGDKETANDNHTYCPTEHSESNPAHYNCINGNHFDCCDTQTIQIQTDDFLGEIHQINVNQPALNFGIIWVAIESIFQQFVPKNTTTFLSKAFPSDGLFLKDVSINTFVCTYRI